MGKGTIVSGGADGLYSVQLNFSRERITKRIASLETNVTELATKIGSVASDISTIEWDILTLKSAISVLNPVLDAAAIKEKQDTITRKTEELYVKRRKRSALELTKKGCEKKIAYLTANMPSDPTVSAWCSDKTEDLSGVVGTIEIPGERGTMLIQPGHEGNAVYSAARDGILEPSIAGTPAGTFWNLAMMPGWQKWKPTYRTGTITALDGDYCSVELDEALSSRRGLDVNACDVFENVPIEYMT